VTAILALILRILLLTLAYLFVGWIAYLIYKDLHQATKAEKPSEVPVLTLITNTEQGQIQQEYQDANVIIGRDPACDLSLQDETISARHCQISYKHNRWWAEDLGSTNGTFLNENGIESPVILTDGDILRLGRIKILINTNR